MTIQLNNPTDLIAHFPGLMGYFPTNCLVVVGLSERGNDIALGAIMSQPLDNLEVIFNTIELSMAQNPTSDDPNVIAANNIGAWLGFLFVDDPASPTTYEAAQACWEYAPLRHLWIAPGIYEGAQFHMVFGPVRDTTATIQPEDLTRVNNELALFMIDAPLPDGPAWLQGTITGIAQTPGMEKLREQGMLPAIDRDGIESIFAPNDTPEITQEAVMNATVRTMGIVDAFREGDPSLFIDAYEDLQHCIDQGALVTPSQLVDTDHVNVTIDDLIATDPLIQPYAQTRWTLIDTVPTLLINESGRDVCIALAARYPRHMAQLCLWVINNIDRNLLAGTQSGIVKNTAYMLYINALTVWAIIMFRQNMAQYGVVALRHGQTLDYDMHGSLFELLAYAYAHGTLDEILTDGVAACEEFINDCYSL